MSGKPNDQWWKTMVAKHGSEEEVRKVTSEWGSRGGSAKVSKGFASDADRASTAGTLGGKRSRRGHRFIKETPTKLVYKRVSDGEIVEFKKS